MFHHIITLGHNNFPVYEIKGIFFVLIQVENHDGAAVIVMNNRLELECLARRCLELLISRSNGEMRLSKFMERFNTHFDDHANLVEVKHSLFPAIIVSYFQPALCLLRTYT